MVDQQHKVTVVFDSIDLLSRKTNPTIKTIKTLRKNLTNIVKTQRKFVGGMLKSTKSTKEAIPTGQLWAKQEKYVTDLLEGNAQRLVTDAILINKMGKQYDSFGKVLKMDNDQWVKFNKAGGEFNSKGAKMAGRIRMATQGLHGFQMQLLSVMFGAQMVAGAMWGLLRPSLDMVGVFDIFQQMLAILFLPIAMFLLEYFFLPLFEILTNLPGPVQVFIGALVLITGALAGIVGVGAALMLFLGGLIASWTIFQLLFVTSPIGWVILGIIAAVAALVAIGYVLWKNWDKIIGWLGDRWEEFKAGLSTIGSTISIFWNAGILLLKTGWNRFWGWFEEKFPGMAAFFETIGTALSSAWQTALDTMDEAWNLFWAGIEIIKNKGFFTALFDAVTGNGGNSGSVEGSWAIGTPYVPHDGLYKLHAGERVTQSNVNNFSPSIVINAGSNVDIDMMKTQLNSQWSEQFARSSRGR